MRVHAAPGIALVRRAAQAVVGADPQPGGVQGIGPEEDVAGHVAGGEGPVLSGVCAAEQPDVVGLGVQGVRIARLHQDLMHVAAEELAAVPGADPLGDGERGRQAGLGAVGVGDRDRVDARAETPGDGGGQRAIAGHRHVGQAGGAQQDLHGAGGGEAGAGDGDLGVEVVGRRGRRDRAHDGRAAGGELAGALRPARVGETRQCERGAGGEREDEKELLQGATP